MTPAAPAAFSQANKLCFRATAQQSAWLAHHMAATGRSISQVLRVALDLYIVAENVKEADRAAVDDPPTASPSGVAHDRRLHVHNAVWIRGGRDN